MGLSRRAMVGLLQSNVGTRVGTLTPCPAITYLRPAEVSYEKKPGSCSASTRALQRREAGLRFGLTIWLASQDADDTVHLTPSLHPTPRERGTPFWLRERGPSRQCVACSCAMWTIRQHGPGSAMKPGQKGGARLRHRVHEPQPWTAAASRVLGPNNTKMLFPWHGGHGRDTETLERCAAPAAPAGLGGFTREWGCRPRRLGLEPVPLGVSRDRRRLASDRLS